MKSRLALYLLFVSSHAAFAAEVTTLNGRKTSGELTAIDAVFVFLKTPDGDARIPLKDVLQLDVQPSPEKPRGPDKWVEVEFIDGTLLRTERFSIKGNQVEFVALPDRAVTVPMTQVVGIVTDAHDPKIRKEWRLIMTDRPKRDMFFLLRGERLDGVTGTFGSADAEGKAIAFDLGSAKRNLPLEKLQALYFNNRLEGNIAPTACRVTDLYGNLLIATKVEFKDAKLQVTTVGGVTIDFPKLVSIARLDFSKGKLVYLSDMKPIREDDRFREFRQSRSGTLLKSWDRDRTLNVEAIQLDGQPFAKGMEISAGVELAYSLDGNYKEFKVVLGHHAVPNVDDSLSHVRVTFLADTRPLYSAEVKRGDKPVPLTLDIKNVRELVIRVQTGDLFGFPLGHKVILADAKVSK